MAEAQLSAVIPIRGEHADLEDTVRAWRAALDASGRPYEMVWVFDGRREDLRRTLAALKGDDRRVKLVGQSRWQGEAAAIHAALRHAEGEIILTLPEHGQVEAAGIARVLHALAECDLAVGRRMPLREPAAKRFQARLFHRLVEWLFGVELADIGCRLRACRRGVLEECGAYGSQHRFLPLIAAARGFRVEEVEVEPGANGHYARLRPLDYAHRLLDVLALFLLLRFTMRPLRFFGPVGAAILAPGVVVTAMVVVSRLLLEVPLADRPALVLGVLMIVLGLQVIALGLIGEIIVFANSRQLRGVPVERVVERKAAPAVAPQTAA